MSLSSSTLFRAAQIAEQIESLEKQLLNLFENQDDASTVSHGEINKDAEKIPIPSTSDGTESERGSLRPAVLKILKQSKEPLKAADIYGRLLSSGYQFSFEEPKKVLQIRLYKMAGVQKAGKGLFKAK
jgi:hypothetical protein